MITKNLRSHSGYYIRDRNSEMETMTSKGLQYGFHIAVVAVSQGKTTRKAIDSFAAPPDNSQLLFL